MPLALLSVVDASCGGDGRSLQKDRDAGLSAHDARVIPDVADAGPASLGWVQIGISGCENGLGTEASPCLGHAPLELSFTVLSPASIETALWNFGDNQFQSSQRNTSQRFTEPDTYDIRLDVEGEGGSAGTSRLAAIVVLPAALGSACQSDGQCASGTCVCPEGTCDLPVQRGFCSLACTSDSECGANTCVDLSSPEANDPWRLQSCLPSCIQDSECEAWQSCYFLPGPGTALKGACFASGAFLEIGDSCNNADGVPESFRCATSNCLPVGLRSMCSSECTDFQCPASFHCAQFPGDVPAPHCLPDCNDFACDSDPGLACQGSGMGITLTPDTGAMVCAPIVAL